MFKRKFSILSLSVLGGLLLFNFQNCAPASQNANKNDSSDPTVRIIDDWSKAEIQFVTEDVQVHDEAQSAGVSGRCNRSRNGARLKWALWGDESSSRPLVIGNSQCKSGQFALELVDLENIVCGIPHRLVVEGDWGAVAATRFERRCQPLASELIASPDSSPAGTFCSLEYAPSQGFDSSCAQVCYRDAKVVFNVKVDAQRCSGLAQKLASP